MVPSVAAALLAQSLRADFERNAAIVKAFSTSEVKDAMAKQGNTIVLSSPAATAQHFSSELNRYAALVKRSGTVMQ